MSKPLLGPMLALVLCLCAWILVGVAAPTTDAALQWQATPVWSMDTLTVGFGCTYCECMDFCYEAGVEHSVCHKQCQADCAPSHPGPQQ